MRVALLITLALLALVNLSFEEEYFHQTDFMNMRSNPRIALGGATCAVCTVLSGMVDQLAVVHRENHEDSFDRLCDLFPSPFSTFCKAFKLIYGSNIKDLLSKGETPDAICIGNGFCDAPSSGPMCHLFPSKKGLHKKTAKEVNKYISAMMANSTGGLARMRANPRADLCAIPLIGSLVCSFLNVHAFTIKHPMDDTDNDWFSESFTLRGSAWRGKDCKENHGATYPGRRPENNDMTSDSNCNGIFGKGSGGMSLENELCDFSDAKGIIALGDSVAANFNIPGIWFDATKTHAGLFKDLENLMDNSFNWPHTSFYTGYQNAKSALLNDDTDSIYLRMRERNLCNHRDYQNIGVNGARTTDAAEFSQSLKRTPQDKPAVAFFSYLGNDVCKYNADPALDDTTTPAQARSALLATMAVLNGKLAKGSYAIVVGVADARPFFDGLRSKIHPFGALRKDVTYSDFYDWLDCLDMNPCKGWLTSDERIREITAKRVVAINAELERTVQESQSQFPNVKMVYVPSPIDEVLISWTEAGGEAWELINDFDGFHPNQKAHKLVAEFLWKKAEKDHPEILGPVNPKNGLIRALFDNQGGH